MGVTRHRVRTGASPANIASLVRVPLRFAKGTFAKQHERIRDRMICVASPVAVPLRMVVASAEAPASAGKTGVLWILGSGVRGNDGFCSRLGAKGISARNRRFGMIKLRWFGVNAPWADVLMNVKSYKEM